MRFDHPGQYRLWPTQLSIRGAAPGYLPVSEKGDGVVAAYRLPEWLPCRLA